MQDSANQRVNTTAECPNCGWQTEVPWSNKEDGDPGSEGDSPPEEGDSLEGIVCPECNYQSDFSIVDVRSVWEPKTPNIDRDRVQVTVDADELTRKIAALDQFVDELHLEFHEEYIETTVVDPANVLAANVTIAAEYKTGFEPFSVAVLTSEFLDAVEFQGVRGPASLRVESESDEMTVFRENVADYVPLCSPDIVRDPGDPFDMDVEFDTVAGVPALKFKGAVGAIAGAGRGPTNLHVRDGELVVETPEYDDPDDLTYYAWSIDAVVSGETTSTTYGASYLGYAANAVSPEGDVDLKFGDSAPLVVYGDGAKFAVAPRKEQEVGV